MMNQDLVDLRDAATTVRLRAYAPYSHYQVGACLETAKGTLFAGCNVENASYSLSQCAEASAISAMIAGGETAIKQIAIMTQGPDIATPCGACRQRLAEFAAPTLLIHSFNLEGKQATHTLAELLPFAFGSDNLASTS